MSHLTTSQAAAILGISRNTVRSYADAGYLACSTTAGGHRRFLESDVRAYLAARQAREKPYPELRADLRTKTALSVLGAAEQDLGPSSSLAAPFAARESAPGCLGMIARRSAACRLGLAPDRTWANAPVPEGGGTAGTTAGPCRAVLLEGVGP